MDESQIERVYSQRTPLSAERFRQARQVFPDGVTHDARSLKPHPVYIARAAGSRKWDVDGNEYVDYAGGHGALLLGHNHPDVMEAVTVQLARGTHFGSCHELEIAWGEAVQRLIPCAERLRFTSSGTEATLLGIRLARAATGRRKIMRFFGHFHGWHDQVAFGYASHFDGTPAVGVLPELADNVVLASTNDWEQTEALLEQHAEELACVILEPTGASWGQIPVAPEFVRRLRAATQRLSIVLFFDEVISGFRCSPGGAQQALGVTPDLTSLAKIIAGGFPGGAIVGTSRVMMPLDSPAAGESREKISHHGTFNANPISAAAGIATLRIVEKTDACERANHYAHWLRQELAAVIQAESVPWVVYGTYSGFHILTGGDGTLTAEEIAQGRVDYRAFKLRRNPATINKLRLAMLNGGVDIFGWPGGPTSAVHTDDDLDRTVQAFAGAIRALKQSGDLAETALAGH